MRILQVTNFFKPSWESGGPARVAYDLSKKLVERGHEVTVYTTDGFKKRLDVDKNVPVDVDGISTYYFRNLSSYLTREMVLPIPPYMPLVMRKEMSRFDIVHIHEYRTASAVMVRHYARKYGVPFLLQAHGSLPLGAKRRKSKKLFDHVWGSRILKDASKVIALNRTEAEQYRKMDVDVNRIEIVPNGIDPSEYEKPQERGRFRREYSIKDDEKLILYVGRLHESKGIGLLIRAFVDLSKRMSDVKLVLVGPDDGYKSVLEEIVRASGLSNDVMFTGFTTNDEKMAAFADADVFVSPSFSGFPITFLESCASGLPIVTTVKGDALEWINNRVGYVTQYAKNDLLSHIAAILTDPLLRERFSREAKLLAKERFSWESVTSEIEDLYRSIVN